MIDPDQFPADIEISSPGRINLIGEHVDYNGGFALPAAIHRATRLKLRKSEGRSGTIHSANLNEQFTVDLAKIEKSDTHWHNYLLGVLFHIEQLRPGDLQGFECTLESNIPIGSGVSSSAALECGFATGLNELFSLGLTQEEIILLSQKAEHEFAGTKCGIMDQFTVVMGSKDHFILLDCRTNLGQYVSVDLHPYTIVLLNSNVSHDLATSAYNQRREECEVALKTIREQYPDYEYLAEVPVEVIREFQGQLGEKVWQRAQFVSEESRRTLKTVDSLRAGDLKAAGQCLYASHQGLSQGYEVSCPELDFLVEQTHHRPEVIGARMMGGGFGGCTINLVHKDKVASFLEQMNQAYRERFQIELTSFEVQIEDGTKRI